jgi:signal transduction histidine kinase
MVDWDLTLASLFLGTAVYISVAVLAFRQSERPGSRWLTAYAATAGVWSILEWGYRFDWFPRLPGDIAQNLAWYAAFTLAGVNMPLMRSFLRLPRVDLRWWAAVGGGLGVAVLLDSGALGLENLAGLPRLFLVRGLLMAGWAVLLGLTAWLDWQTYQSTRRPLHRNRIAYWAPVIAFITIGDIGLFIDRSVIATAAHIAGIGVAAYAVLRYNLQDIRHNLRQLLAYVITLGVSAGIYALLLNLIRSLRTSTEIEAVFVNIGLMLLVAIFFAPILRQVQRLIDSLISRVTYDPGKALREYSSNISNLLDVNQLARTSINTIRETLGLHHGRMFLVERHNVNGLPNFYLRSVGDEIPEAARTITLAPDSPVADYLYKEYHPLTQYEIDLMPRFTSLETEERSALSDLDTDVYVPIYSKGNWIGLFVLGPKVSRDRYFDEDLILLGTIADQTTVALENARLVENLMQLNRNLREAYGQLGQANKQMEQLDRAKTDFIAVLSHELRTPMGILLGYSQLLAADPVFAGNPENLPIVDGLNKGAHRLQELTELMLDMATIDTRVLKLYHKPVPVQPIIKSISEKFATALTERQLTLKLEASLATLQPIEADIEILGKVFYHLIVNAIKYTPNGGKIIVSGRAVEEGHERLPQGGIEVMVTDTGIGIDPQFHEVIFAKFYRTGDAALHSSGKIKFKGGGPGLGLAIARGVVEAHGGQIWVESTGHDEVKCPGSQFHVVLPLKTAPITRPVANGTGTKPPSTWVGGAVVGR